MLPTKEMRLQKRKKERLENYCVTPTPLATSQGSLQLLLGDMHIISQTHALSRCYTIQQTIYSRVQYIIVQYSTVLGPV